MTEGEKEKLSGVIHKYKGKKGELISILQEIQAELGYLPREAMEEIANFLGTPRVWVWGVATFYNQFRFVPLGRYPVSVCLGTACHLAGGKLVLESLERELKIKVGETTEDLNFSLERVACIGCCTLAPVVVIKDKIYPKMTPFKLEESLISYRQESIASHDTDETL